jgi:myosin-7
MCLPCVCIHIFLIEEDTDTIFDSLKAILFLGNIAFVENNDADGGCSVSGDSEYYLNEASRLLGYTPLELSTSLTIRTIHVRGEVTIVPLSVDKANDTRNAFSKEIYGRLFAQIVAQANLSLAFAENEDTRRENAQKGKHSKRRMSIDGQHVLSIGLLDIFGFEIFTSNSFEQLCINYGNEKLQQYFLHYVLKKEQETYESEGIEVEKVVPIDNEDVLHLLESKPTGLFSLLDEELRLPQGSDVGFLKKVEKEHKGKSRFHRDFRMAADHFEIHHFAGKVQYSSDCFLEKNKDKVYDHLEVLLVESQRDSFKRIMLNHATSPPSTAAAGSSSHGNKNSGGGKGKSDTLASRFTGQLQDLVNVLHASEPHFVRCLKPNNAKSADIFDSEVVLRQLRYSGVLEVCANECSICILVIYIRAKCRQFKYERVDILPAEHWRTSTSYIDVSQIFPSRDYRACLITSCAAKKSCIN